MMYTFTPCNRGAVAFSGWAQLAFGSVVELDDAEAARLSGVFASAPAYGAGCLVPVAPMSGVESFMAAISDPTEKNPETEYPEADDDAAPAKRGRGRPKAVK